MYMVCAFERGRLVCDVGDGHGLDAPTAIYFAHDLRAEFPDAVVAILPAPASWSRGWPWTPERAADTGAVAGNPLGQFLDWSMR